MGKSTYRFTDHLKQFPLTRMVRGCVLVALAVTILALAAVPAYAGAVTIVGQGDQLIVEIDEDSFYEVTLTAVDAWGDSIDWLLWEWMPDIADSMVLLENRNSVVFRYTPPANYNNGSPQNVGYASAMDGMTGSDSVDVFVTVNPVNDAPVITEGSSIFPTVEEDGFTSFALDATDVEGDTLMWLVSSPPSNGWADVDVVGNSVNVSYIPNAEFSGSDPFEITVSDGGDTDLITVDMGVTPVNDPPSFTLGSDVVVPEDSGLQMMPQAITIEPGDGEFGQSVTFDVMCDNPLLFDVQPAIDSGGLLTFTSAPDAYGTANLTVTLTDDDTYGPGTALTTDWQYFAIEITPEQDPPVAVGDDYAMDEDTPTFFWAPGVMLNDSDPDGDSLTAWVDTEPSHGDLFLMPNGEFTFWPDPEYNGPDEFTYFVTDTAMLPSLPVTVSLTVNPVNDPPSGAVLDNDTVDENEPTGTFIGTLSATDVDSVGITFSIIGGDVGEFEIVGDELYTAAVFDYETQSTYSLVVRAEDGGGAFTDQLVGVYVTNVDEPPVVEGEVYGVDEETELAGDVTTNDYDPESDPLTWTLDGGPSHAASFSFVDGIFSYTPVTDYVGPDTFTYLVDSGTEPIQGTVTIDVTNVNDAPVANMAFPGISGPGVVFEDTPYASTWSVLDNDTDIDGDEVFAELVIGPTHGAFLLLPDGTFNYTPEANYTGPDLFSYRAFDGIAYSGFVTNSIWVTAVEDDPVITQGASAPMTVSEDTPDGIVLDATDADVGSVLTWSIDSDASNGAATVSGTGTSKTVAYTSDLNYNGTDEFSVLVTDDTGRTDTILVQVTVDAVNDAPLGTDDTLTVAEDSLNSVPAAGVLGNDGDVDGDPLGAFLWEPPLHANGFMLNEDGSYDYEPEPDYNGPDSFTYVINDGTVDSAPITVFIDVTPVNDAPTDVWIGNDTIDENSSAGMLVGAFETEDIDSGVFAYSVVGASDAFEIVGDELRTLRPLDFEAEPAIDVTVRTDDGAGGTYDKVFTIHVTDVDEASVAGADTFAATEDTTLVVPAPGVLANDSDPEGAALEATIVASAAHGTVGLAADGSFAYEPVADFNGQDSFTYQADDGGLLSEVTTVIIDVASVNDAPVTASDTYSTDEDVDLAVAAPGVLGNDTDMEGDALVPVAVQLPAHGTLTLADNGALDYTPPVGWSGSDTFTYKVSDGDLESNISTVTITVSGIDAVTHEVAGNDRLLTAVEVSKAAFATGADTVVIATAQNWPDALGGSALAGAVDGPILLTSRAALCDEVLAEIERLGATDAYVLGGENAVSADVAAALDGALAGEVIRLGGATRYETAHLVAEETIGITGGADGVAFLAKGTDFPDALAASSLAAYKKWPIYLSPYEGILASTKAAMTAAGVDKIVVLGGDTAVAPATEADLVAAGFDTERIPGADRYETAVSVADYGTGIGLSFNGLAIATGQNFPDGLSGGVLAGKRGAVMLLNPCNELHPAVGTVVTDNKMLIDDVFYLGGLNAVAGNVRDDIAALLQ